MEAVHGRTSVRMFGRKWSKFGKRVMETIGRRPFRESTTLSKLMVPFALVLSWLLVELVAERAEMWS